MTITAGELLDELRDALQAACQPTSAERIVRGRERVLALPRAQVLANLERVAAEVLDLSDYWEYRRLLELAAVLDADLTQRLVALGLDHADTDVKEAADDFRT
jgi:hypothetical protein